MKASELRIGNYLDRGDYICKVVAIDKDGAMLEPLSYTKERSVLKEVKPIPLTEEWLVEFGFVSNPYIDTYELRINGELIFLLDIDKTKGVLDIHWQYIKIKHVHQLQNLYFALTGEELQINEQNG